MGISKQDLKSKDTTMSNRFIDIGTDITTTPKNLEEVISLNRNEESITRYDFEVTKYGITENILNDYAPFLTQSVNIDRVMFTKPQARHLQYNISMICQVLYGDINMRWAISYLNDLVKHPADLSSELLYQDGLLAFNETGIEALRELLNYKEINEQNDGNGSNESLFTLDSF